MCTDESILKKTLFEQLSDSVFPDLISTFRVFSDTQYPDSSRDVKSDESNDGSFTESSCQRSHKYAGSLIPHEDAYLQIPYEDAYSQEVKSTMETMANEMLDIVGDASRRKASWKDKTERRIGKPAGRGIVLLDGMALNIENGDGSWR